MGRRDRYIFAADQRKRKRRHTALWILLGILGALILTFAAGIAVSRSVKLYRESAVIPDLPEELRGFRILHVSDLHGEVYGSGQQAVGTALDGVSVSCVVMTGDMLGKDGDFGPLAQFLDRMPTGVPVYCIPGDEDPDYLDAAGHGTATPYSLWAEALIDRGGVILDRPVLVAERGRRKSARLWLIPDSVLTMDLDSHEATWQGRLDSMRMSGGTEAGIRVAEYQLDRARAIRESVADIRETDILILVTHMPLTADMVSMRNEGSTRADLFSTRRVSLVLSGHLCAGQFRLPGLGAVSVPGLGTFPEDDRITGMTWVSGLQQDISPGLGASSIYPWWASFRFFNPPAMTLVTLTSNRN